MKLCSFLNKVETEGDVGIEIEVEGSGLSPLNSKGWTTTDDGSLRGRYPDERAEYVLKSPIKIDKVGKHLKDLASNLEASVLRFSYRTSVHVHINCLPLETNHVLNFIYLSLIYEDALIRLCGEQRIGNRFCLRLQDAEGASIHLNQVFSGISAIKNLNENAIRYANINLAALRKYGSLEFRGMEGNIDVERLTSWINILYALRAAACKFDNPFQLYEKVTSTSIEKFTKEIFDKEFDKINYLTLFNDLCKNFSITLDFPFAYRQFNKDNDLKIKPPIGKKPIVFDDLVENDNRNFIQEIVPLPLGAARQPAPLIPVDIEYEDFVIPAGLVKHQIEHLGFNKLTDDSEDITFGRVWEVFQYYNNNEYHMFSNFREKLSIEDLYSFVSFAQFKAWFIPVMTTYLCIRSFYGKKDIDYAELIEDFFRVIRHLAAEGIAIHVDAGLSGRDVEIRGKLFPARESKNIRDLIDNFIRWF